MTHRVSAGIYAHAIRLRLKGAPFFPTRRAARRGLAGRFLPGRADEPGPAGTDQASATPDGGGLLGHAAAAAGAGPGTGGPRAVVLAAGTAGRGRPIEVTEGGGTFRLGPGEPMARVTVHDRRAYGALLRSASVGLGTSYVAGWWDADDLTAFVAGPAPHRPLRERLDRLGRAVGAVLDLPARLAHRAG